MVTFSNCKINIGLHIVGKRADGYHNIETLFYPIPIKDAVEIIEEKRSNQLITFTTSGNTIDVKIEENICVKAYQLLKKNYPTLPPIKMHLHKVIPMGAGLGGGSSNATAVLQILNTLFNLQLTTEKLLAYALMLGSDCPFFVINKPCFATGRGQNLTSIHIDLSNYKILLVNPKIHVDTKSAFEGINEKNFSKPNVLLPQVLQPIHTWAANIKNDFELSVFLKYPQIEVIKNTLYKNGAIFSAMSGSGSTVFGIFDKQKIPNINFPSNYYCQLV